MLWIKFISIFLCEIVLKWMPPKTFDDKSTFIASGNILVPPENKPFINTLRPRWNEPHFADDIFKRIYFNENVWISIKISLKFVPKGPINNIPALVQIMAWHRSGDKPLSEPMMVSLLTHICVTRPQWVNWSNIDPDLSCHMLPLFDWILANKFQWSFNQNFHSRKFIWKCLKNGGHFVQASLY